jgi:anaerobic magnesium-protoporphyrin IX monomethyl ester cyclase
MQVILINPNSSLINNSWAYRKFCSPIAPLGLCYIAAALRKKGIDVSVIDQFATKISNKDLIDLIKRKKPELVGFSVLTPLVPDTRKLAKEIRGISADIKIVLGNIHGTCFPDEVLQEGMADIVVRGEGEITMLELCHRLDRKDSLKDLPGISYRIDGQIVHNPERGFMADLDSLPYPAWDMLSLEAYRSHPMISVNNAIALPVLASRGCDYRCYYCSQDKSYNKFKYRKLEEVVNEIEYFNTNLKVKTFGFCDAYFPFDEKSGFEFCDTIIRRKLHKKIRWVTETRVDKVTPDLLKIMKAAGLHLIMYGIEVGNETVLKSLGKGTTLTQARTAVKESKKAGILTQGLFMLGLPGETEKTCKDTINFARELDCDIVKFNVAVPYPGSRFFQEYAGKEDLGNPDTFTSWIDWTASQKNLSFVPKEMSSEALRYLQRKAMFEFYVRPKVIIRHIAKGTISLKNVFLGGIWLIFLFVPAFMRRIKSSFNRHPG